MLWTLAERIIINVEAEKVQCSNVELKEDNENLGIILYSKQQEYAMQLQCSEDVQQAAKIVKCDRICKRYLFTQSKTL